MKVNIGLITTDTAKLNMELHKACLEAQRKKLKHRPWGGYARINKYSNWDNHWEICYSLVLKVWRRLK